VLTEASAPAKAPTPFKPDFSARVTAPPPAVEPATPEPPVQPAPGPPGPPEPPRRWWFRRRTPDLEPEPGEGDRPPSPRLRKLRLILILVGLAILAIISTLFGMLMAVASDLPQLENRSQYKLAANSYLYDDHWRPIGIFAHPTMW
jgi:penicillin-binding protein 1A